MGYFDWIIGTFALISGLLLIILGVALAVMAPEGLALAMLICAGVWGYAHWAKKYVEKRRSRRQT